MEDFYFLFEDLNNYQIWYEKGFSIGFLILLFPTLLSLIIFYLVLGRQGMRYSNLGSWFLFALFNVLAIFLITLIIEGFTVFEIPSLGDFYYEIWLFSMLNAGYGFVAYVLFSLVFKRFSIFSKYYPVKF